jgi:hypothetical protein
MALLFFLGAAVQLNDPDPARWFAIYLAAGAVSLVSGRLRRGWQLAAGVSVVALVWAAVLAPGVLPALQPAELFESMQAETPEIEKGRELLGLLIIGGWMLVSAWVRHRAARRNPE